MAQRIGQRAHPLQDRDLGQHLVDEMGCGTGHAATAARRIEAVGKHAAVEVPTDLAFDAAGDRRVFHATRRTGFTKQRPDPSNSLDMSTRSGTPRRLHDDPIPLDGAPEALARRRSIDDVDANRFNRVNLPR